MDSFIVSYLEMWLICNKLECHTKVNYMWISNQFSKLHDNTIIIETYKYIKQSKVNFMLHVHVFKLHVP